MKYFFIFTCFIFIFGAARAAKHEERLKTYNVWPASSAQEKLDEFIKKHNFKITTNDFFFRFEEVLKRFRTAATSIVWHVQNTKYDEVYDSVKNQLVLVHGAVQWAGVVANIMSTFMEIPEEWKNEVKKVEQSHSDWLATLSEVEKHAKKYLFGNGFKQMFEDHDRHFESLYNHLSGAEHLTVNIVKKFLEEANKKPWLAHVANAVVVSSLTGSTGFGDTLENLHKLFSESVTKLIGNTKTAVNGLTSSTADKIKEIVGDSRAMIQKVKWFLHDHKGAESLHRMETRLKHLVANIDTEDIKVLGVPDDLMDLVHKLKNSIVNHFHPDNIKDLTSLLHKVGGAHEAVGEIQGVVKGFTDCVVKHGNNFILQSLNRATEMKRIFDKLTDAFGECHKKTGQPLINCAEKHYQQYKHHFMDGATKVFEIKNVHQNLEKARKICKHTFNKGYAKVGALLKSFYEGPAFVFTIKT